MKLLSNFYLLCRVVIICHVLLCISTQAGCSHENPVEHARPTVGAKPEAVYRFTDGQWNGFIDRNGHIVLEPSYDIADYMGHGFWFLADPISSAAGSPQLAARAIMSPYGEMLYTTDQRILRRAHIKEGLIALVLEEDGLTLVGERNGFAFPPDAIDFGGSLCESRVAVSNGEHWGYANWQGDVVIPYQFERVTEFSEGRAFVQQTDGLFSCIDRDGAIVFTLNDNTIVDASPYREGLARIAREVDGEIRIVLIDPKGEQAIEEEFQLVGEFANGCAAASPLGSESFGLINHDGMWITEPKYFGVGHRTTPMTYGRIGFIESADRPCRGGYLDQNGNEVIVFESVHSIGRFHHGAALVRTPDWFGLIDVHGEWIWSKSLED